MSDTSTSPVLAAVDDLMREMERIVSQQRRMSYFLMLLQEETGRDDRLRQIEMELKRMESLIEDLSHRVTFLEHIEILAPHSASGRNTPRTDSTQADA